VKFATNFVVKNFENKFTNFEMDTFFNELKTYGKKIQFKILQVNLFFNNIKRLNLQ